MVLAINGAHVPTRPDEAKGKRRGGKRVRAKRATREGEWKQRGSGFISWMEKG